MNKSVRILHLRASNFVGGPERQLLRYASYERGGPIEIIVGTFVGESEGRELVKEAQQRGIPLLTLPAKGIRNSYSNLKQFLREQAIGLVCTHGYKADILGTLAARAAGIPVACFLRGWTGEDWKVRSYELLDRGVIRLADRIVCVSQTQALAFSARRKLAGKTRTVLNVINPRDLSQTDGLKARRDLERRLMLPNGCPVIATAGRLSPEKGVAYFIDALPAIRCRFPEAQFVVFGDGPLMGEFRAKSTKLGLDGVLRFAGHMPDFPEKLLPGINLIVNPSLAEVMPNILLEAMAAGVPVVATDVGGVREIAGKEGAVCLVPSADSDSIAKAVVDLLGNPTELGDLGVKGRHRTEISFSPTQQRQQLRSLYREMIPSLARAEDDNDPGRIEEAGRRDTSSGAEIPRLTLAPFITAVVPVRNEEAHLRELLGDLIGQDYPADRYEILVADGNSTDRTPQLVEEFTARLRPRVVRLQNPKQLSSAGRNVGVQGSHGDIILFVDGHCRVPNSNLLSAVVEIFERTGADCLCRPQPLTMPGNTWFQDVVAQARASFIGHGMDSTIYAGGFEGFVDPTSSGAIYKRSTFERVGLFDEQFDACEDVEFNYRVRQAGFSSYLSSRLAVQYRPRPNLFRLFKQLFRYGRGRFRLVRKHRSALTVPQLLPPAFLLFLLAASVLALAWRSAAIALAATFGVYAAVLSCFSAASAFRHGWRHLFAAPAVYTTIYLGLGCGFWAEIFLLARASFSRSHRRRESSVVEETEGTNLSDGD